MPPGVGPLGASAIVALLPNPRVFGSGRDFAAWIGLTPREASSGKTTRRGGITKKGDGYLRHRLVPGAIAHLALVRRGRIKQASEWLRRMAAHPRASWRPLRWPTRRRARVLQPGSPQPPDGCGQTKFARRSKRQELQPV